jgi:hypothetical protein
MIAIQLTPVACPLGPVSSLEYDHHQATYHLTEPVGSLPLVSLSQGEFLAIYFAEKVLRQYRGTPFEPDLASAFAKMQELLPEEVKVSPESLDAYLSLDLGPLYTPDAAVFREILTAEAAPPRGRAPFSPYHVFNLRGNWYVAAWDEDRRGPRLRHPPDAGDDHDRALPRSRGGSTSASTWRTRSESRRAAGRSRWLRLHRAVRKRPILTAFASTLRRHGRGIASVASRTETIGNLSSRGVSDTNPRRRARSATDP